MKTVTAAAKAESQALLSAVSCSPSDFGALLRTDWAEKHGCEVIPVEPAGRLSEGEIDRVVRSLSRAGYSECLAIPSEDLGADIVPVEFKLNNAELTEVNKEFGLFEFVLVSRQADWAIACNVWFTLFGARPELVREMIGRDPELARRDFDEYAGKIGGSLPHVAALYRQQAG